jgi:hypothetical protein
MSALLDVSLVLCMDSALVYYHELATFTELPTHGQSR